MYPRIFGMNNPKRPSGTFNFEVKPHVLIIEARYYEDIADLQLQGTKMVLERVGATHELINVPSVREIPVAITYAIKAMEFDPVRRRFDGYVPLGCIIKGGTQLDEILANETSQAIQNVALEYTLAIGNGILIANTHEQAVERADPVRTDRGGAAADACLRMIELKQHFRLSAKRRWTAK
jgi:6,7-dimethyl-8-ribityllumazine synthase